MKWIDFFKESELKNIKLNLKFAELEFSPSPDDEEAAWKMYVELLTRITTQTLEPNHGDEKAALDSIYKIFHITREILKEHGRKSQQFTKLSIIVLNQVIRPFTAKWHRLSLKGELEKPEICQEFRAELLELQNQLTSYIKLLAKIAKVEDLTKLDKPHQD